MIAFQHELGKPASAAFIVISPFPQDLHLSMINTCQHDDHKPTVCMCIKLSTL